MSVVAPFIAFNLFPSMVAGGVVLLLVLAGLKAARITHGPLRLCLLAAPIIASTLVLIGLLPAFRWSSVARDWQARAVPFEVVAPVLGGVFAVAIATYLLRGQRSYAKLIQGATASGPVARRLEASLDRVVAGFGRAGAAGLAGCPPGGAPRPALLVTDRTLDSPVLIMVPTPTIVFPRALAEELDEAEIDGALAHELAHLLLQRPAWCSTTGARLLGTVNPVALALSAHLHAEEEKACDEAAVAAVGSPEAYAGMLLKAFRFARRQAPLSAALAVGARLLGRRSLLADRIEHLMASSEQGVGRGWQYASTALLWSIIVTGFMST